MSRSSELATHLILQYGIDLLDQAYADLPVEVRKQPHIREAMAALDALCDAIGASMARALRSETSARSLLNMGQLERPLAQLMAVLRAAPEDHRHDILTWRWKQRCERDRGMVIAWKKKRTAK
jgi:enamine deaminase RidA (YjgF/YER057c/UK114 family)